MTKTLLKTCLYELQEKAGAKFIEFSGYHMPVWFQNIQAEHEAVRTNAGIFDISHMGVFLIQGDDSESLCQELFTNDITRSNENFIYGFCCNESGMILDDVMIGKFNNDFLMVVNASNKAKLWGWISQRLPQSCSITELTLTHTFLAIQGPNALSMLESSLGIDCLDLKRMGIQSTTYKGQSIIISRTGYTGEDGCECVIPNELAPTFYQDCIDAKIVPCGLGARDTLRIEKGFPLYGHEISETLSPLITRYPWAIKLDAPCIGRDALLDLKQSNSETTIGLKVDGKMIPRQGYKIVEGGIVTSGTMSPSLQTPIAMAIVPESLSKIGTTLHIEIRSKQVPATVCEIPFV